MPRQKTYVGKINNPLPLMETAAKRSLREQARPVKINLSGEWKGFLHLDHPRAVVWARMIDFLQKNNRPVYVELDYDTEVITKLCIPIATKIIDIHTTDELVVYVGLTASHATHYLRRNLPDFERFLLLLQQAKDTDSTIMITSTNHEFEIIDVREIPLSFGNDGPPEPPPPPVPDPPVTPERAQELLDMFKAQTCTPCSASSPCIPFKYPYDGCWIRAHLMCYQMIALGETPEKVWIGYGGLVALSSNVPQCQVGWGWHVAPTLMVSQTSGPDIKMVIDPSLCDEPVTLDDWKALMNKPTATLTFTEWGGYNYLAVNTASEAQANNDMETYRMALDELCAEYGPSPYACPIVKKSFFIIDRSTISKDEVDAMLLNNNPAVIEAAFYVVVDGYAPSALGITASTLVGVPNIKPVFSWLPAVSQMTIDVMAPIKLEDPVHLIRPQRITWKYKISFTGSAGFVNEVEEINLSASIDTVSATGKIYLIKQPNPYEIDGETSWLSTDLRVFQIKAGETRFNKMINNDANNFITDVIQNLNSGNTGGDTFSTISTDQQTSRLELSESISGVRVYNFAVAKVRYRAASVSATDVRVFFRLFPASSTSLEFNQSTTYRRATQGGSTKPLLGIINNEAVTIPCFAAARIDSSSVSMTDQTDTANVQTIPPNAGGNEVVRYFGCWLDINQTQLQFPFNPSPIDGPWTSGRQSVQEHVRNEHQCLVAEIAFDPTPIPAAASPSISDKLAQRNLAIVQSANPGQMASHRIPHTFEIKPTRAKLGMDELPDELMIDWGNVPVGCIATLYFSGIETNDILSLGVKTYRPQNFIRIDAHTLQCETGGMTYIPIPEGEGSNFAGMLSVDLPATVKKGEVYTIVVHQVTSEGRATLTHEAVGLPSIRRRKILGSFQITIPVVHKEEMLVHEEVLLSNLRWIQLAIPATNRWFDVFNRYVSQIGDRVDALGGNAGKVVPSPSDDWKTRVTRCATFGLLFILLLAGFIIISGALTEQLLIPASALALVSLLAVSFYWRKKCTPSACRILKAIFFGAWLGLMILAILLLCGISTPQLMGVFIGAGVLTAVTGVLCWRRKCF